MAVGKAGRAEEALEDVLDVQVGKRSGPMVLDS